MTRIAATLALLALLTGCAPPQNTLDALNQHTVCTLDGHAYFVRWAGGDAFFIAPMPDTDPVCALPR